MKDFFTDELTINYSRIVVFVFNEGKKGIILGDYLLYKRSPYLGKVDYLDVKKVPNSVKYSDVEDSIHVKKSDISDFVMKKIKKTMSEKNFKKFKLTIELNELKS